jgi:hypothetical protein
MATATHPAATPHVPAFITAPGETDVLMVATAVILSLAVLGFGLLFLRIHTLPERMAHRRRKLQLEIVAVLGLLALLTHIHLFWVAGLLLALIDLPDFVSPLNRIAGGVEKIAGDEPEQQQPRRATPEDGGNQPIMVARNDTAELVDGEPPGPAPKRPELVPTGT